MESIKRKFSDFKSYLKTDRFCLDLFLGQFLVLFVITLYVFAYGNPAKMSKGLDPNHLACGIDLGMEDYPYIYFVTPNSDYLFRTFCARQCPSSSNQSVLSIDCKPNSLVTSCNQNPSIFNVSNQVIIYDSMPYKENVCVPNNILYFQQMEKALTPPSQHQLVHDLFISRWGVILIAPILACLLTIILMKLIDDYFQVVMWIFIIGTLVCLAIGGIEYFQIAVKSLKNSLSSEPKLSFFKITDQYMQQTFNAPSFGMNLFISLLMMGILFSMCTWLYLNPNRIEDLLNILLLTDFFMEDSQNKKLKQFSFIMFCFLMVSFSVNFLLYLYLLSCANVIQQQFLWPFEQLESTTFSYIFAPFVIFIFLWQNQFVLTCVEYVTISSIRKWFSHLLLEDSINNLDKNYVKASVKDLTSKLPQIAKASILLLTLTIPKMIVDTILDQIKNMKNQQRKEKLMKVVAPLETLYQTQLRSIEAVMLVEIDKHDYQVDQARQEIVRTLNQNQDDQEQFEQKGNLCLLFYTIGRSFIAILMFALASSFYSAAPKFDQALYSHMFVSFLFAIVGIMVSSLYLAVYGLAGQTILYLYYSEKNIGNLRDILRIKKSFPALYSVVLGDKEQEQKLDQSNQQAKNYVQMIPQPDQQIPIKGKSGDSQIGLNIGTQAQPRYQSQANSQVASPSKQFGETPLNS